MMSHPRAPNHAPQARWRASRAVGVAPRTVGVRPGFTLVELLVAATVTVMVAGAAIMILNQTAAARQRIDRQREVQQQARASVTAIATALRNAYRPADREDAVIEGQDDWFGDLPRDRVRLFTVSRRTTRADQPESDVREVEFFILDPRLDESRRSGEFPGAGGPSLMRRIDPTRNPLPDGGGVLERVAEGVQGLNLTYYDGVAWRDEWTLADGWPVAVRVEVLLAHGTEPGSGVIAPRLVNFPHYREPADAGESVGEMDRQMQRDAGDREGESP